MQLKIGTTNTKPFSLPVDLVTQTAAIIAVRGVGKTFTASVHAEELIKAGQQVIIMDPLDVWWGLRSSADGKKEGLPITVLGGMHGDLPLNVQDGVVIADFVVEHNISVVLSMRHFSGNEQRRFVTDFFERLYHRKGEDVHRTPVHVFIDEADAFCPQKVWHGQERMVGAVDTLVRRGRASGLGVTMITQRAAAINKDILTQIDMLICLRIVSPQDRKAVDEWIKSHDVDERRDEFMTSLASLPVGTAWYWSPGWLNIFSKVDVRPRETFDSSKTPKVGVQAAAPKTVAKVDIKALQEKLSNTIELAKKEDPRYLRAQIADLQKQLAAKLPPVKKEKIVERHVPVVRQVDLDRMDECVRKVENAYERVEGYLDEFKGHLENIRHVITNKHAIVVEGQKLTILGPQGSLESGNGPIARLQRAIRAEPSLSRPAISQSSADGLHRCELAILTALAQYPEGRNKSQLAILTGYSGGSGGFNNSIGKLRSGGYAEGYGQLRITALGKEQVRDVQPLPTGEELFQVWLQKLGKCERSILRVLASNDPDGMNKMRMGVATGYSVNSGGFNNSLSRLRTLELITRGDPIRLHALLRG